MQATPATRRFVLHYLGDLVRDELNTSSSRDGAYITSYETLEAVPDAIDRQQFEWMLEQGEPCTSCGSFVYQIRN